MKKNKQQTSSRTEQHDNVSCWSSRAMVNLQEPGKLEENDETHKKQKTNKKQETTKRQRGREERNRRAYPEVFRGRRESAGSVYIRCSTPFSPANSAESVRSLSASLHSVTGECNWRKSNPYWLRWPSPVCIWRSDGACSLLSGGTEIAVWVTVI